MFVQVAYTCIDLYTLMFILFVEYMELNLHNYMMYIQVMTCYTVKCINVF